jgi:hypothetical protein
MSKSVAETEHLKEMLVGNILTVSRREVRATAMVYGVIGAGVRHQMGAFAGAFSYG